MKDSRLWRKYLWVCLLLCAVTAQALASNDTVHIKQVPYKDATGNLYTLTLYGGDGGDFARSIICDEGAACSLFGYSYGSFGGSPDFLVLHFGSNSNSSWAETFGGTNTDLLFGAIRTRDGGYFTSGSSQSMFFTFLKVFRPHYPPRPFYAKLDSNGKLQWAGNIELESDISGAEVSRTIQTSDGGYLLIGSYWEAYPASGRKPLPDEWSASAPGNTEGWQYYYPFMVKLSADGKPQWMRRYIFGDTGGMATSAVLMPSGDILVAGTVFDKPDEPLFMMQTDPEGNPLHTTTYAIPGEQGSNALIGLQDGSYMLVGHAIARGIPHRALVAHFAADGSLISGVLYSNAAGVRPLGMVQAKDGKICIVGRTENPQTKKAAGVAWLTDEQLHDLDEFWLWGDGNTELEDVALSAAGGFDIVGDTNAFGADQFDLVRLTWKPTAPGAQTSKELLQEPYKPTLGNVDTISQTGKTGLIRVIPVNLINVKNLNLPAIKNHN